MCKVASNLVVRAWSPARDRSIAAVTAAARAGVVQPWGTHATTGVRTGSNPHAASRHRQVMCDHLKAVLDELGVHQEAATSAAALLRCYS
jgi:hypothetical protein